MKLLARFCSFSKNSVKLRGIFKAENDGMVESNDLLEPNELVEEIQQKIDTLLQEDPEANKDQIEALQQQVKELVEQSSRDHNDGRQPGDLDGHVSEDIETTDGGRFNAKAEEDKKNNQLYEESKAKLQDTTYRINDLRKQNEILGAGYLNLKFFKTESQAFNEIRFRGEKVSAEIVQSVQKFSGGFEAFADRFKDLQTEPNEIQKKLRKAQLTDNLVQHLQSWKVGLDGDSMREKVLKARQELEPLLLTLIPDAGFAKEFSAKYFEELVLAETEIAKTIDEFLAIAQQKDFDFSGTEPVWHSLRRSIDKLNRYLDLGNGEISEELEKAREQIRKQNQGLDYLEEKEFFSNDETVFYNKFTESQKNFRKNSTAYRQRFLKAQTKILRDIDYLDDSDFLEKYGESKEGMSAYLQAGQAQIESFEEVLETWGDKKYFQDWLEKYRTSDETRAEALVEVGYWKDYEDASHNMVEQVDRLDDFLNPAVQVISYKFSLYDLYQMFKRFFEKRERLWKRRSERAVANLGMDIFANTPQIGKEFDKEGEEEEDARVKEYETQKDSKNGWDIQRDLYNTNDADEAKACINLLIKKGFMRWDDWDFWKTLNRLEGFNRFYESDLNLDSASILNKVRESCSTIWQIEYFEDWDKSMGDSLKSAQDGFKREFGAYETADSSKRNDILAKMLHDKYNGNTEGVNPARYEAFLRTAIEYGKMNGGPMYDTRFYFLIHGVASGLLSRDAFARINDEFLARMPFVDFFSDRDSWKKDGRIVPPGTEGAEAGQPWQYKDYLLWAEMLGDGGGSYHPRDGDIPTRCENFWHDVIASADNSRIRVRKMVRFGKDWDHEDAPLFVGNLSTEDIMTMISKESSGAEKSTPLFWSQYLLGFESYFKSVVRRVREGDAKYGRGDKNWMDFRTNMLQKAGETMKSGIAVIQTLNGNVDLAGQKRSTTFNEERWNETNALGVPGWVHRDKLNDLTEIFINKSDLRDNEKEKYLELITHNSVKKNQPYGQQVLSDGESKTEKLAKDLIRGEIGDGIFKGDPDEFYHTLAEFFG